MLPKLHIYIDIKDDCTVDKNWLFGEFEYHSNPLAIQEKWPKNHNTNAHKARLYMNEIDIMCTKKYGITNWSLEKSLLNALLLKNVREAKILKYKICIQ